MAAINTQIRRQPVAAEPPREPLERDYEWQGWQVHRLPTCTRYEQRCFGLLTRVVDYGETLYWRVFGSLDGVPGIFHGEVGRDPFTPSSEESRQDGLKLALEVAWDAAGRLRLKGVVPSEP